MQTLTRRVYLLLVILLFFTIPVSANAPTSTVDIAAQSLINRHATPLPNEWAWQSVIQSPHYQLDRDVGAASIGVGFLAGYDVTLDAKLKVKYLNAAEYVANFIVEAQTPANSGRWPDYYDPAPVGPASYGYTSLDDGAAGISDFLWLLYERDNYSTYKDVALTGINWLVSMAQAPLGANCPKQQCYWRWRDPYNNSTPIYTGIGSGMAGIVYTLDKFAERTGNPSYQKYALAGAAYLEAQINVDGSVSEKVGGRAEFDTGLYAGAAGDAFVFYSLYLHTHDDRWLNDANKIMAWVRLQGVAQTSGTAWPISVGAGNIGNRTLSTEVAEGAAGIGWAELQAYKVTHDAKNDLATAQEAGDWLLSIAVNENNGYTWPAYAGQTDYYTALDLGVGGISVFLHDLSIATGNAKYEQAAQKAQIWLSSVQFQDSQDSLGAYWYQDRNNGTWTNPKEPSWDWGLAGILGSAASLNGWTIDMPRDVPGF